jgi:hypothetical protein
MGFHELVPPGEAELFEGFAAELAAVQQRRLAKGSPLGRALHFKQHLGVVGELVIQAAEPVRTGVFATNGQRYPVYVRFSNGSSGHQSDKLPDARGFAIKLVGVPGRKIIEGLQDAKTQDFLFLSDATVPFRDPSDFMIFQRAAKDGPAKLLPRMIAGFGLARTFSILKWTIQSPKVVSYATHEFHSVGPISFGATAAKLALFPVTPSAAPAASGVDYLRRDLIARLQAGPITWTLRAQLFQDDATTPIEDTSLAWSGPFHDLATLTLPKQDPTSAQGQARDALVETLSFDPWHAVEAHRPLGAIMRARSVAYRASVLGRKAAPEPTTVDGL